MTKERYRRHLIHIEPGDYSGFVGIVVCDHDGTIVVVAEVTEPTEAKALQAARERIDLLVEKPR